MEKEMTIEELKDFLIERGIKSCESEKMECWKRGCIKGFEMCRNLYTPDDFEKALKQQYEKEHNLRMSNPSDEELDTYWEIRYITLQIEFVFERLKVAWCYPMISARAGLDYAEIVGVKGGDNDHKHTRSH